MRSCLFLGEVMHHRLEPVDHRFRYPLLMLSVDLEELPELSRRLPWFGYNRSGLLSLYDRDYLDHQEGSLEARLRRRLPDGGRDIRRIQLITGARFLGHVFNPVSFYFCYDLEERLRCVVAEVNNTFGERHAYLLDQPLECPAPFAVRYQVPKAFYVSPFNRVEGDYDFRFADPRGQLDCRLRVLEGQRMVFNSWMRGRAVPLRLGNLVRYPLTAWMTLPRIHWEAALLYFQKKLPLTSRPRPQRMGLLRADPPTALHRAALALAKGFLGRAQVGRLEVGFSDGSSWSFGPGWGGSQARMEVNSFDLFLRLLRDGDVGLGDGYVAGEFDSPDLTRLLRFLLENREALDDRRLFFTRWLGRAWHAWQHRRRRNTLQGSRQNIPAHYDLGNRLFTSFLDPTMSYSCAYFEHPGQALEEAQRAKIRRLLEKARLQPGQRVLEIGCGWGSLALEAARSYGCLVTGLTLSHEQLAYARERVREAGMEDRVHLELCDYRQARGSYDRILSVEMLEAVGHENLGAYFAALERLLSQDGLAVLQVITVPDFSYDDYRRNCDWIQKEIFPGGLAPSLTALSTAMARHSRLVVEHLENIGPHYAPTLRAWRERFRAAWPELSRDGRYDERFRRAWEYYLSYSEAGFASRNLGNLQLVLTRPKNLALGEL